MEYILVMCLSTNVERASNYTIVKQLILTSTLKLLKKVKFKLRVYDKGVSKP